MAAFIPVYVIAWAILGWCFSDTSFYGKHLFTFFRWVISVVVAYPGASLSMGIAGQAYKERKARRHNGN